MKVRGLVYLLGVFMIFSCSNDDSGINTGDGSTDNDGDNTPDVVFNGLFQCENGMAGPYPCNDYDLMAYLPIETFGAGLEGNDCWGWTDAQTGNEYAIMGVSDGAVFVDVTDVQNVVYLGKVPTATENSIWRDIKIYNDHAFIVSEANDHGMQVFDLTRLRNVANPPEVFTVDAHFTDFGSAHNIVINENSGYAYPVGANLGAGGPLFVNIQSPTNPISEGVFSQGGYSHDAQVVTYTGPDQDYQGAEICIGSNANEIVIANFSDKSNPTIISTIAYPNIGYTHQGWFTEDSRYFILGDELDEQVYGNNTISIIFDFNDLDNPVLLSTYEGATSAIDHNGYTKGDTFYLANYTAGVRMLDLTDIASGTITEKGFFDTYPSDDVASFDGVWNVYPYFPSGNILVSDINTGMYIIRKHE